MNRHYTWTITNTLECLLGRGISLYCQITPMLFLFLVCDLCSLTSCFVCIIRRNTSVDESYEWDSADACVDAEVLEATRFDQSQMGFRGNRGELRYDQTGGLQDQRQKGD